MDTTESPSGKRRGLTLVEFIIVAAIISVFLAIIIPWNCCPKIRPKVSKVKADLRVLGRAIEAYQSEHGVYPGHRPLREYFGLPIRERTEDHLRMIAGWDLRSPEPGTGPASHGLTTPFAFIEAIPGDPFSDWKGMPFAYYTDREGWIIFSAGPDTWYNITPKTDYDSSLDEPGEALLHKTHDPTNGSLSDGDIWRRMGQ